MDIYEKSLDILKKIIDAQSKLDFRIYLLGGWAVWLFNPYMKSKDIDLVVKAQDSWKLGKFLASIGFKETIGAEMKKKGFVLLWNSDKIEIDVYDKMIGKWSVNELVRDAIEKKFNNKSVGVLSLNTLFLLKAFTALERLGTAKGEKDLSDVLALLDSGGKIDFKKVNQEVNLKELFAILLKNFRTASRLYPLELKKYKQIKQHLEKISLL